MKFLVIDAFSKSTGGRKRFKNSIAAIKKVPSLSGTLPLNLIGFDTPRNRH
jgi:hypothetical protein